MNHVKLEIDGQVVYESGVIVAPGPTDPPPPPPPPPPTPDPEVSDEFKALVAQRNPQLDMMGLIFHLHRKMTPAELAYTRLHSVPGADSAPPLTGVGGEDVDALRRTGTFEVRDGARQFWRGEVNQIISLSVPLPVTFHGGLEVIVGESPAGGLKVNAFDCWVSLTPAGSALGERFTGGSYASFTTQVHGPVFVNIEPRSGAGGGFSDIHLHPQA